MPASLIVYRASTRLGRARTFHVDIDGAERATVRGAQHVEIELAAGRHAVSARLGTHVSPELAITLDEGEERFVVIDIEPDPDPRVGRANTIVVRTVDTLTERATVQRGRRPVVGNSLSRRERAAYFVAIFLLFSGQVLIWTNNRAIGIPVGAVGTIVAVVVFFRKFTYRRD